MIDNGSSTDILYLIVYEHLVLDHRDLEVFHTSLKGFWGVEIRSVGLVKLSVKIRKYTYRTTPLLDFVVVDLPHWPYNALLGMPFLNKIQAITAMYYLKVKFSTKCGVSEVRGDHETTRRTNLSVFKDRLDGVFCKKQEDATHSSIAHFHFSFTPFILF
ncbi:hypothetical protein Dsin_032644 [Dipteronia sinensis]|uniref:Uncharacterized protein n=1 Tax=Dipteronia sinensis TaxID=43782 RepID=A0AAD9ZK38_9ROSI|nr:hypothetical protein Dsin_032644 [Dipteronia sinensis]